MQGALTMRSASLAGTARSTGVARPRTVVVQARTISSHRIAQPFHHCRYTAQSRANNIRPAVASVDVAELDVNEVEEVVEATEADAKAAPAPSSSKVSLEEVVLLQGFGWSSCEAPGWWKIVKENVPKIKELGVTHAWLPPPSQSVAPQGYLPGQLYNLNSKYGNKEQLQELVKALKDAGIVPVADIVINHRCADEQDENGVWNNFRDDIDHNNKPVDWGQWAITGDDPDFGGTGNRDTGADYHAAPDLDHTNEDLQRSLIEWLNWLKDDIGFEGWRYDFVKGFAAYYCDLYTGKTVTHDAFNVGENWVDLSWGNGLEYNQDGPRQALCNWLDGAGGVAAFDFVTKGILAEAVRNCEYWRLVDPNGKAPGLMGWWPSKAVTFIDNHDTGSTQQHWPFPGHGQEETGYAYIMTHPGTPTILWEHFFDNQSLGQKIKELVDVRKRNGIKSTSSLHILKAEHDIYVAKVDDKLVVKLGPRYDMGELAPKAEDGWVMACNGKDFGVWEKK